MKPRYPGKQLTNVLGRCSMKIGVITDIHNNVVAKVYPSEINLYEGTISLLIYSVHR